MSLEKMRPEEAYKKMLLLREKCGVEFFLKENKGFIDVSCPSCLSEEALSFEFFKYGFRHIRCNTCNTVFVTPRPDESQLLNYYSTYESPAMWTKILVDTNNERKIIQNNPRIVKLRQILQDNQRCQRENYVDVGAGNGNFARMIQEEGLFSHVTALEISQDCIESCKMLGLFTQKGSVEDLQDDFFDCMSMNDLIEHVCNPSEFVNKCYQKLRVNGIIMISTPNGEGFDFKILKEKTENITPPEHLQYFNPFSLRRLLEKAGFSILDISTPGVLDVEIIRKQISHNNFQIAHNNDYLDYLFSSQNPELLRSFQEFLSKNLLSSHMLTFAMKTR